VLPLLPPLFRYHIGRGGEWNEWCLGQEIPYLQTYVGVWRVHRYVHTSIHRITSSILYVQIKNCIVQTKSRPRSSLFSDPGRVA
jgi:hypothetical protein